MHHLCLELAAYHLTSEVCSCSVRTTNHKFIVLLGHIFIYEICYTEGLKLHVIKYTRNRESNINDITEYAIECILVGRITNTIEVF